MSKPSISDIKKELSRLGKPHWIHAIEDLAQNYIGYPFEDPGAQSPLAEIHRILQEIDATCSDETLDERFIRRLMRSDIFSYRAQRKSPTGAVFWDPLHERFIDFKRYEPTTQYQTEHEHPAPDIIRTWYYHKLRSTKPN